MLLSIVVNLLSSVNGTQYAAQAASPLDPIMAAAPPLLIPVGAEYADSVLRSRASDPRRRCTSDRQRSSTIPQPSPSVCCLRYVYVVKSC